jgi:lauroyl/myristoyl acyltransferase
MKSLVELGYGAGWSVVKALPESVTWPLFRAGADRAARRGGPGAQRLRRNLRRVVGPELPESELDLLVRDGLRSYARYWLEAFRLPAYSRERLHEGFRLENGERIGEAVEAGTGCVIALPHAGNWDFAGAWVCSNGWPLTTVAERLRPEGVYQKFVAYRESLGMEIIPTEGGGRPPIEVLEDRLRQARVVPLLADRDLSARGIEVNFFGEPTRMPAGPALLALRTGAPLFTVSLWYEDGVRSRGRLDGPLPLPAAEVGSLDARVRALTQTIADHLAAGIAAHPADWHMLQRLWLADVPARSAPRPAQRTAVDADPADPLVESPGRADEAAAGSA